MRVAVVGDLLDGEAEGLGCRAEGTVVVLAPAAVLDAPLVVHGMGSFVQQGIEHLVGAAIEVLGDDQDLVEPVVRRARPFPAERREVAEHVHLLRERWCRQEHDGRHLGVPRADRVPEVGQRGDEAQAVVVVGHGTSIVATGRYTGDPSDGGAGRQPPRPSPAR